MFCSKCGARNEDNAKFCASCGNTLSAAAPPMQAPAQQQYPPAQPYSAPAPPGQKDATLATIINFFLPGIGYWYWGYRKVSSIHPVLLFIIVLVVDSLAWNFLFFNAGIISLAIAVLFAYDLHVKTTGQRGWIDATM